MRIRAALALAAGAVALLAPAQANALGVRPCDDGSVGVIVFSASEIARVCLGDLADYPGEVLDTIRDIECWWEPNGLIRCEMDRLPPPPIR